MPADTETMAKYNFVKQVWYDKEDNLTTPLKATTAGNRWEEALDYLYKKLPTASVTPPLNPEIGETWDDSGSDLIWIYGSKGWTPINEDTRFVFLGSGANTALAGIDVTATVNLTGLAGSEKLELTEHVATTTEKRVVNYELKGNIQVNAKPKECHAFTAYFEVAPGPGIILDPGNVGGTFKSTPHYGYIDTANTKINTWLTIPITTNVFIDNTKQAAKVPVKLVLDVYPSLVDNPPSNLFDIGYTAVRITVKG